MNQFYKTIAKDAALAITVAVAIGAGSIVAAHTFRHFPVKFEQKFVNAAVGEEFSSPRHQISWKVEKIDDKKVVLRQLQKDTLVNMRYGTAIEVSETTEAGKTELEKLLVERGVPPRAHFVLFDKIK